MKSRLFELVTKKIGSKFSESTKYILTEVNTINKNFKATMISNKFTAKEFTVFTDIFYKIDLEKLIGYEYETVIRLKSAGASPILNLMTYESKLLLVHLITEFVNSNQVVVIITPMIFKEFVEDLGFIKLQAVSSDYYFIIKENFNNNSIFVKSLNNTTIKLYGGN